MKQVSKKATIDERESVHCQDIPVNRRFLLIEEKTQQKIPASNTRTTWGFGKNIG